MENPEQAMVLSIDRIKEERQKSLSPRWNLSPDVTEYNQGPTGSSGQHNNNSDIMDMLVKMEQRMKERDDQLKLQLQFGDEYLEAD